MNKIEIVEAIAKEAGITKADAERALNGFQTVVAKALKNGKKVTLTGFGTYAVSTRKARNGEILELVKQLRFLQEKLLHLKLVLN